MEHSLSSGLRHAGPLALIRRSATVPSSSVRFPSRRLRARSLTLSKSAVSTPLCTGSWPSDRCFRREPAAVFCLRITKVLAPRHEGRTASCSLNVSLRPCFAYTHARVSGTLELVFKSVEIHFRAGFDERRLGLFSLFVFLLRMALPKGTPRDETSI